MMKKYIIVIIATLLVSMINTGYSQNTTPANKFKEVKLKTIHSDILNEDRNLYIYVPEKSLDTDLPVIYLLDGEKAIIFENALNYARTNPHIIIGIETSNKNRSRDMFPVKVDSWPGSGGGENFLQFLVKELQPFVNNNYKTNDSNILIGGSASGLFTLNAMLTEPDKFTTYISISPVVGYCNEFMTRKVELLHQKNNLSGKLLYMNYGLKHEMKEATDFLPDFNKLLSSKFNGLLIHFEAVKDGNHCPKGSIKRGLDFVYKSK